MVAPRSQAQSPAFEVASVKPGTPGFTGAPRVPDGDGTGAFPACAGGAIRVAPQRFSATNTTLYTLITLAYGIRYSCFLANDIEFLSGGPKWVLSDRFDVQAVMPAGSPTYTLQQLQAAEAPVLQAMLRHLLAERFTLAVHQTKRNARVYVLTALPGAASKLTPARADRTKSIGPGLEPTRTRNSSATCGETGRRWLISRT